MDSRNSLVMSRKQSPISQRRGNYLATIHRYRSKTASTGLLNGSEIGVERFGWICFRMNGKGYPQIAQMTPISSKRQYPSPCRLFEFSSVFILWLSPE